MGGKMKVYPVLFIVFGVAGIAVEILFRGLFSGTMALMGTTSIWMFPIYGVCGVTLGMFNQIPWIRAHCNVFGQSVLGSLVVTCVELVSGLLLNVLFGFGIWDYSMYPANVFGQVCLLFSVAWFLISPFVFWLDDIVRFYIHIATCDNHPKGAEYSLLDVYGDLLKFWEATAYQANEVF
jgi:uncharacterized membrane protein